MQPRFSTQTDSDRSPKFNVVVAFDNREASSSSALKTCDYVIQQLGGDIQVRRKVVDFEQQATPRARRAAARDAAQADMVIVSTRERAQLPADMQAWLDDWSSQRSGDVGALVAIVQRTEPGTSSKNGVREQLAHLAEQMHMDFFSSEVAP